MPIATFPNFVFDCPDPGALGAFYAAILDWELSVREGWADLKPADGSACISFQQVDSYVAPTWPTQDIPQQLHLDVMVEDLDRGEEAILVLGAVKTEFQPGESFRVYLDPAGHPFCLCQV